MLLHGPGTAASILGPDVTLVLSNMTAMQQDVVQQNAGHHRLTDRHRANTNARIMAPFCDDLGVIALLVDGLARGQNRTGRLHSESHHDVLPGRDATQDPTGMVR